MAIQLISAKDAALQNGIKVLIYGPAGAGKTVFCTTAPDNEKTLMISAEGGLLSIQDNALVDICWSRQLMMSMKYSTTSKANTHTNGFASIRSAKLPKWS